MVSQAAGKPWRRQQVHQHLEGGLRVPAEIELHHEAASQGEAGVVLPMLRKADGLGEIRVTAFTILTTC